MGKILSYNNKTTGEGWIALNSQYNADEIEMIADPNGGLSQQPRTAIPSPFAQMDLVKNAFSRLAAHRDLHGEAMDERLVAHALDIAQLFFSYPELQGQLHIVEWNRQIEMRRLLESQEHKLLGETMAMYLEQDKEAFNFDKMDRLYFLVYGNKVLGCTSPVSLFMATPNAKAGLAPIPVEPNVYLFDLWRPLYMRDEVFVSYIYALFTAYPDLKKCCGEVNRYLITSFRLLPEALQAKILKEIGNPDVLDLLSVERAKAFLDANFTQIDSGVQVLGFPLYCVRQEDVQNQIANSDFVVAPTRDGVEGRLPLILQNHLNAPQSDPFIYINRPWDDTTVITPADYAPEPEKRILPATNHQYCWLTDDDFFQPALIKLDYRLDGDCFFDGNLTVGSRETDDKDFVLPLKPTFFKYFKVSDLWGTIAGKPKFELVHTTTGSVETVKAILRIPVKKTGRFITLERVYEASHDADLTYDSKSNKGRFVTVPFALGVFPFVRTASLRQYNVQLIDRALGQLDSYRVSLDFYRDGYLNRVAESDKVVRERSRKSEKRVGSYYYRLQSDFDYISVTLTDDRGKAAVEGIVCPKWPEYVPGHDAFTFAVDFGTTNTHIECMRQDNMPEPLHLHSVSRSRLLATLYNGSQLLYDVIIKQEFLPKEIGGDYGFPQRTVLSECERVDAENVDNVVSFGDANIPFIYEKESVGYGNRIVPNLKWSTDLANGKRVRSYLTELALLMRTKVLLENGDMAKTRLVWFYPLSMKVGTVRKMAETWAKIFEEVFGVAPNEDNLIQMPESVAPYYFYKGSSTFRGAASTVASIDIGGGSSDVVVFGSNAQQPALLTSFRFAANVLFGDGFSEIPHGDTNPMLVKYVDYFKRLFDSDDDRYGELNGILDDIAAKGKSEDINAFLFSVINNKVVNGNDVFSYNLRLNEDGHRKIIFIYFYVAMVYYVACMMKRSDIEKPRSVMFSGTGSKVLGIVGSQRDLDQLTQVVFERVYGETYDADGFSVIMEKKEPKQITCRGALMQVRNTVGCTQVTTLNRLMDDFDSTLKQNFSMIGKERLCYDDMDSDTVRQELVDKVREFNRFFVQLCEDIHVVDRFLVENRSLQRFKEVVDKDLGHYLINGWNFVNKNQEDRNGSDVIEDAVFFYPIIGSIRDNLIENLKE